MLLGLILSIMLPLSTPKGWADTYALADSLTAVGEYHESLSLLEHSLPGLRGEQPASEEDLADGLSLVAVDYFRLGLFEQALQAQIECYGLDEKSGDPSRMSSSLNSLAGICLAMGDTREAEDYILRAIEIEEKLDRPKVRAVRYGMASEVLLANGRASDALEYSSKAYALEEGEGNEMGRAVRLSQLAACYIALNRFDKAESCLETAIPILEQAGNDHSLAICLNQMGSVYLHRDNRKAAVKYLRRAAGITERTQERYIQAKSTRLLADALRYDSPDEAFDLMVRHSEIVDTMYSNKMLSMLEEFNVRYDTIEKDAQIMRQEHDLRNHRTYIVLLVVVSILLLVVAGVLLVLHREHTKRIKMLNKANELKDRLLALDPVRSNGADQSPALLKIADELSRLNAAGDTSMKLSPREIEVVQYCCQGLISKEIAAKMGISVRTVNNHKANIFKKMGVNTTVELVNLYNSRKDLFVQ